MRHPQWGSHRVMRLRPERAIAEVAAKQRGVITRLQLLELGLTRTTVDNWVKHSRLHPVHRGVFLLGYPRRIAGARELAAVLACGPGAALSHLSAAGLWRLLPGREGDVEVTVAGRNPGRKRGIRVHRVRDLDRREIRKLGGIPITSPARTIFDLAAVVGQRELEQALAEAFARRLARRSELASLLARRPSRPGTRALRGLLDDGNPGLTRSEAEERFLALIRRAELLAPETNVRIDRHEVDFLWREQRVIVEVDGFAFHSSRSAFERDRRRDVDLSALGFRVMRVTWRQIVGAPEALVARLAAALAAG
jgi:very-short-patch-repair endonuclease